MTSAIRGTPSAKRHTPLMSRLSFGTHHTVVLVLSLFLLLTCPTQAFWFGGDKNKNGNNASGNGRGVARRRLMDVPTDMEDVDVDAATGTVKPQITPKEQADADAAKTCNGQLAQSLVLANDERDQAQMERDQAQKEQIAATNKASQLESSLHALEAQLDKFTKAHEQQVQDYEKKLAAADLVKQEAVRTIQEYKEVEINALKEAVDKERAEWMQEREMLQTEKVAAVTAMEQAKDDIIDTLKQQLEQSKDDSQKELEAKLTLIEASNLQQLAELQAKLDAQVEESQAVLQTTREEAKRILVEQVSDVKAELADAERNAKAALAQKDQQIQQLNTKIEQLSKYQEELLTYIKQADAEIERFQEQFAQRSYCNMTYISNDLYEKTLNAYAHTQRVATVVADTAVKQINHHGKKLANDISSSYDKSRQLYNEQYEKHWPTIEPHYQQYVAPLVAQYLDWKAKKVDPVLEDLTSKFQTWKVKEVDPVVKDMKIKWGTFRKNEVDPRIVQVKKELKNGHAQVVKSYASTCQSTYKSLGQLAKEHDLLQYWNDIGPAIKDSCQNAEGSVNAILRAIAVLLVIIFAGRILSLAWSLVRLAWSIFLTVTLLRFILPRGKAKKQQEQQQQQVNGGGTAATRTQNPNGAVKVKKRPAKKSA